MLTLRCQHGINRLPVLFVNSKGEQCLSLWVGLEHKPVFWILGNSHVGTGTHIAFKASSRSQVNAFYHAAIAAGGTDNGKPGLRRYHPNYYGAFNLDPDGINIEAVCHSPA
jgi:catechol 2,3-dioxygenase-like lactoylglutathione lyase family enzyme